jgi:hypothetical protein
MWLKILVVRHTTVTAETSLYLALHHCYLFLHHCRPASVSRSISGSSRFLFHEQYSTTNLESAFSGMDFYELLDIPQGDRRKYHDDVTIMVISLEGRIWKSSGTYVWCSADILSVSVFIPMQYSAEMNFSRSALPGDCTYAHQEGKSLAWHTAM